MDKREIVRLDIAFYVDSETEGEAKMDAVFEAVEEIMDCKHSESVDAVCKMVGMSGQVMTGQQYDEWFDKRYPENS